MNYRYEALSLEGFIQQLAVNYVPHGYWFYVVGRVPAHKDVRAVDEKLLRKYDIVQAPWTRSRRKRQGLAGVHYLRHEKFFVLLASAGQHRFFAEEAQRLRDCREAPLRYGGYAVSYVAGHACVRIDRETYQEICAQFLRRAVHQSARQLEGALRALPFEPYAPVRLQLLMLRRQINQKRQAAGLEVISKSCLPFYRNIYAPFTSAAPSVNALRLRPARPLPSPAALDGRQKKQSAKLK
jgi:hypothetical protein